VGADLRGQRVGVHGQVDDAHRRSGDVGERIDRRAPAAMFATICPVTSCG